MQLSAKKQSLVFVVGVLCACVHVQWAPVGFLSITLLATPWLHSSSKVMQQDEKVGLGQSQNQQGIRIIKPAVVAHCNPDKDKARNAIYSCDIQKGGERIATGGGGMCAFCVD